GDNAVAAVVRRLDRGRADRVFHLGQDQWLLAVCETGDSRTLHGRHAFTARSRAATEVTTPPHGRPLLNPDTLEMPVHRSTRHPLIRHATLTIVLLAACVVSFAAVAGKSIDVPATLAGGAGSSVPIGHWQIQSSAKAQEGGHAISQPGYATDGWHPVDTPNATVIAGLMQS